jgi:NADPH:quinone reductase-like Zn-dependent oxidoreductase
MRSVVRHSYGPPEILKIQEIPKPAPKANEILVRVFASTVNRTDCGAVWGKPYIFRFFAGYPRPRHLATGSDFAGVVEEIGSSVTRFHLGQRVFGFNDHGLGSHAEYLTISQDSPIAIIPENTSFENAAASLEGGHYAYNFISKVSLKKGDRVFVNGATGAIGSAAIPFLMELEAIVTATAPTEYVPWTQSLGVEKVIDYQKTDFTKTEKGPFSFVFDAVGKSSFSACKPLLSKDGVYISSELGPHSENPFLALITPLLGGQRVVFPIPVNIKRSLTFISDMLDKGKFQPLIDPTKFKLEQISEAFEYVNSGKKIGSVVLNLAN